MKSYVCRVWSTCWWWQSPWYERTIWEATVRGQWAARIRTKLAAMWADYFIVPRGAEGIGNFGVNWSIEEAP